MIHNKRRYQNLCWGKVFFLRVNQMYYRKVTPWGFDSWSIKNVTKQTPISCLFNQENGTIGRGLTQIFYGLLGLRNRAVESEFKSNPIFPIFGSYPIFYSIFIRFYSNF